MLRSIILTAFAVLSLSRAATGQESYFYTGKNFGSEAMYNPLNLILNGSYDIIQLDGHSREIIRYPFARSASHVFGNLGDPFHQVRIFGTWKFITDELLPINVTRMGAQWWPNYQLHLIGGGMTYAAMSEWYELHGCREPKLLSLATMAVYHLMNEIIENNDTPGNSVDSISDVYFFDTGGILLFSFDGVKEFFSKKLNMSDWSLQPSIAPRDWTLQNNGQYFSVKWKLPFSEHWHLFYLFGMNGLGGMSYRWGNGASLSAGGGLRARSLRAVDPGSSQLTADLVWNAGVFYDIDNSLLASLFISGLTYNRVILNVYPGLIRVGDISPGVWFTLNEDNTFMAGITTRWAPGIAFR